MVAAVQTQVNVFPAGGKTLAFKNGDVPDLLQMGVLFPIWL